jgi:hypothetical protein
MKLPVLILFLIAVPLAAQDQKTVAQEPKPATQPSGPCAILKRMGPADEVTSHVYSFGLRGKQYQYVEGDLPKSVKFHGRLTDNDVRQIMNRGGKIQLLEPKYTIDDLAAARRSCSSGAAGATQADLDAPDKTPGTANTAAPADHTPDAPAVAAAAAPPPEAAPASTPDTLAKISVTSSPDGADIYADGDYVGSAPAILKLSPGKHSVKVTMAGFKDWERDITTERGSEAHLTATLEKSN